MSTRAVILGLLGAAGVCSYTYFNDFIVRQTMFIGNNMPISVYGLLVIVVLFLNPLLGRLKPGWALRRGELAVVLAMVLVSCCIPGSNFLRVFTGNIMLPHRYVKTEPAWASEGVVDMVPPQMLADVSEDEDRALNGFVQGVRQGDRHIGFRDVPWQAWGRTFRFWLPMVFALWVALLALAVVVHRQWRDHEHLPYPIVSFTKALLPESDGRPSSIFHDRLFWIGFCVVLAVHLNNYLCTWFPDYLIQIPREFPQFRALIALCPTLVAGGGWWLVAKITLYFTVIAIAYFIPAEVSLSLGAGPYLYSYVNGLLSVYGIGAAAWLGGQFGLRQDKTFLAGAYFGMVLIILYNGRFHWLTTLRNALNPRRQLTGPEGTEMWAARTFMLAAAVFVACLMAAGLDLPMSVLFAAMCIGTYLVMGRIIAETGLFFIQTWFFPVTVLWVLLGTHALGPRLMLIMFLISSILVFDTREALMPFAVNALKLGDDCRVKVGRLARWCLAALVIGVAVGLPMTLYYQYDNGLQLTDWRNQAPKWAFEDTISIQQRLAAQGTLESAGSVDGLARFRHFTVHRAGALAMAIGLILVLLFAYFRLRLKWWPLHPMMFLVCTSYAARCFAASFLIGWLIKTTVMRYGGVRVYNRLRPLFFGIIGAEMLGGFIPTVFSLIYYLVTNQIPESFRIMPG